MNSPLRVCSKQVLATLIPRVLVYRSVRAAVQDYKREITMYFHALITVEMFTIFTNVLKFLTLTTYLLEHLVFKIYKSLLIIIAQQQ